MRRRPARPRPLGAAPPQLCFQPPAPQGGRSPNLKCRGLSEATLHPHTRVRWNPSRPSASQASDGGCPRTAQPVRASLHGEAPVCGLAQSGRNALQPRSGSATCPLSCSPVTSVRCHLWGFRHLGVSGCLSHLSQAALETDVPCMERDRARLDRPLPPVPVFRRLHMVLVWSGQGRLQALCPWDPARTQGPWAPAGQDGALPKAGSWLL